MVSSTFFLNTRSLVNIDRRAKLSNAVQIADYNVICLCETWLNEQISDSELLLNDYNVYRSDRTLLGDKNAHGGSLIAVKNSLNSEKIKADLPDSSLACKIKVDRSEVKICSFYNPPNGSEYRYNITDLLKNILKSKPALICCDLNFPDAHWKTASSSNEEENKIIEIFDEALFRQAIDFPTCSNNTLELAFYQNCFLFAEKDQSFPRTSDCTDHDAIHLSINCPVTEPKPVLQLFRSFGNADYDGMNKFLKHNPFQLICHKNVNTMCEEVLPICRPSG